MKKMLLNLKKIYIKSVITIIDHGHSKLIWLTKNKILYVVIMLMLGQINGKN